MSQALLERWQKFQPTKVQTFWLAAGAAVAVLIAGFGPAGWVTAGKAQQMVQEAAANARTELAIAVCVEEFMGAAGAQARLAKLETAGWYERGDMLAKGGWATMPDRKEPNSAVAVQCAARLSEPR